MTVAFGVPVKVTVALPPGQTVALAAIATVGSGKTVITMEPVNDCTQLGTLAEATLTKAIVVVVVYTLVTVAVPDAFSVTVCVPPGFVV